MIAIPLDNHDATTISAEYVRAPFFALLDTITGYYKVIENTKKDSLVVEMIHDCGADITICQGMDESIGTLCTQRGVTVYETARQLTIDEVYESLKSNGGIFA